MADSHPFHLANVQQLLTFIRTNMRRQYVWSTRMPLKVIVAAGLIPSLFFAMAIWTSVSAMSHIEQTPKFVSNDAAALGQDLPPINLAALAEQPFAKVSSLEVPVVASVTSFVDTATDEPNQRETEVQALMEQLAWREAEFERTHEELHTARQEMAVLVAQFEHQISDLTASLTLQSSLMSTLAGNYATVLENERAFFEFLPAGVEIDAVEHPRVWADIQSNSNALGGDGLILVPHDSSDSDEADTLALAGRAIAQSNIIESALALDESLAELTALHAVRERLPLGSPVDYSRISSNFGLRHHPITGLYSAHRGIDLAAPAGTPVRVQAPGEVVYAGWMGSFGRFVEIAHNGDIKTRYAHLAGIDVALGDQVEAGQTIASVGSSGRSTGPHLHYEIIVGKDWVDPRQWIQVSKNVSTQETPTEINTN